MGVAPAAFGPVFGPAYPAEAGDLAWSPGGGAPPLLAPSAPTIAGTITIGGTLTITPGAGGGPVTSNRLLRNGVDVGAVVSGYTYTAQDIAIDGITLVTALTVEAVGPGGTSAPSNALAYSPTADTALALIEWWTARAGLTLAGALCTSQAGQKNGYALTAAGAARPSYSATAITDVAGGTHAGLVFAGAQIQTCSDAAFIAAIHAVSTCKILFGGQGAANAAVQVLIEQTANFTTTNGAFAVFMNDTNANSVEGCGQNVGSGVRRSNVGQFPWIDPGVLRVDLGGADTTGCSAISLDGVAMLTGTPNIAYVGPAVFANDAIYVGARAGIAAPLYASLADIMIVGPAATENAIASARLYMGAQIGALQA